MTSYNSNKKKPSIAIPIHAPSSSRLNFSKYNSNNSVPISPYGHHNKRSNNSHNTVNSILFMNTTQSSPKSPITADMRDMAEALSTSLKSLSISVTRMNHNSNIDSHHLMVATPTNMFFASPKSANSFSSSFVDLFHPSEKLEKEFCRNFTCCGLDLEDLHHLLKHIEEVHTTTTDNETTSSGQTAQQQQSDLMMFESDSTTNMPTSLHDQLPLQHHHQHHDHQTMHSILMIAKTAFKRCLSPIRETSKTPFAPNMTSLNNRLGGSSSHFDSNSSNNGHSTDDNMHLHHDNSNSENKPTAVHPKDIYRPVPFDPELTDFDDFGSEEEDRSMSQELKIRKMSDSVISLKRRMPFSKKNRHKKSKAIGKMIVEDKEEEEEEEDGDNSQESDDGQTMAMMRMLSNSLMNKNISNKNQDNQNKHDVPVPQKASMMTRHKNKSVPDLTTSSSSATSTSDLSGEDSIIDIMKSDTTDGSVSNAGESSGDHDAVYEEEEYDEENQYEMPTIPELPRLKKIPKPCTLSVIDPETGERKYICAVPTCKKQYRNANGLKYHLSHAHPNGVGVPDEFIAAQKIRESEDYRPYQCTVANCSKRYKNLNGLKYHIEHAHNAILPPAVNDKSNQKNNRIPPPMHPHFFPPHPNFMPMFPFPPPPGMPDAFQFLQALQEKHQLAAALAAAQQQQSLSLLNGTSINCSAETSNIAIAAEEEMNA